MAERITKALLDNTLESLNRAAVAAGVDTFELYRANNTVKLMQRLEYGMRDVQGSARGGREVYLCMNAMREALWLVAEATNAR